MMQRQRRQQLQHQRRGGVGIVAVVGVVLVALAVAAPLAEAVDGTRQHKAQRPSLSVDKVTAMAQKALGQVGNTLAPVPKFNKAQVDKMLAEFRKELPPAPAANLVETKTNVMRRVADKLGVGSKAKSKSGKKGIEDFPGTMPLDGLDTNTYDPAQGHTPPHFGPTEFLADQNTDPLANMNPPTTPFPSPIAPPMPAPLPGSSNGPHSPLGASSHDPALALKDLPMPSSLGAPHTLAAQLGNNNGPDAGLSMTASSLPPAGSIGSAAVAAAASSMPGLFMPPSAGAGAGADPHDVSMQSFQAQKKHLDVQRQAVLAHMQQRKAQIEHLQSFVDGGQHWVDKMKQQLNQWMAMERQKGAAHIATEEMKVNHYKDALKRLLEAQKDDAQRVNQVNKDMRDAANRFKLEQQKRRLQAALDQERSLKAELEHASANKADLQKQIDEINGKLSKSQGGGSASGSASASASAAADAESAPPSL